jgi:selenocysteine-specific elongation factor
MIIATAGHVDHGKTSLVRALTGIDTDRLPEEKRRGMTIEPGFAHADWAGPEPVAFVDLPGHERFARHMLAGITAVDAALLVVAADDGPMPQTLEHLAVLDLLGIKLAVVVLSKVDRCDAVRLHALTAQISQMLDGTTLAGTPILPVSAPLGQGLEPLRALIGAWQRQLPPPLGRGRFRMAIDRCFLQPGAGRVVAGTVMSGTVAVGDILTASPTGAEVRVRALQVHGAAAERARSGQRCALNIVPAGAAQALPERGDWLLDPALHAPTTRVDAHLRVLAAAPRAVEDGAKLQLHLGATMRNVRLDLLDARRLAPGEQGLVQLLMDRPVSVLWGEPGVLRDAAAQCVVGGVRVIDPAAPARRRAQPARLRDLAWLSQGDPMAAFDGLVAAHAEGVEWPPFARARDLEPTAWRGWPAAEAWTAIDHPGGQRLMLRQTWQALQDALVAVLAARHRSAPQCVGLAEAELLQAFESPAETALRRAALRAQLLCGGIVRDGFLLRLPGHKARLQPADEEVLARVIPQMLPAGLRPVPPSELAPLVGLELAELSAFLERAAELGHLVQVAKNRFFLPAGITSLVEVAKGCAADSADGRFDAKSFRDRSGLGRNLSIQVLEFFDRSGITRYANERRAMLDSGLPVPEVRC